MMRAAIVALALVTTPALAQPASPASTQTGGAAKPDVPAVNALALELAIFVNSEAKIHAQMESLLKQTMPGAMKQDPNLSALEAEFPGIIVEAIAAMEPIMLAAALNRLPALQQDVADIYVKHLTASEMRIMLDFYRSPLGLKFAQSINEGMDFSSMLKGQLESMGEAPIKSEDLRATMQTGIKGAAAKLTPQERVAIAKFTTSIGVKKLTAVNRDVLEASTRWANMSDPATDTAIEKAMTALLERRTAANP